MPISLVIVTDGTRLDNLRRCISSCKNITQETVVVYQGKDQKILDEIDKWSDFAIMSTPKGNADPDRNFAWGLANNEWVLMLDDDEYVPEQTAKFIHRIIKSRAEVVWFEFQNLVDGVDIEEILGPDPHPRLWRKKEGVINWPEKAHTFPNIPTPLQYFTKKKIIHERKFDELFQRHLQRIPQMDQAGVDLERRFIDALKKKLGKK